VELIAPGTRVRIGDEQFDGFVSGVTIRGRGHVMYEVVYWCGPHRKCEWVEPVELHAPPTQPAPIRMGFAPRDGVVGPHTAKLYEEGCEHDPH
jgi:hypothetical protein